VATARQAGFREIAALWTLYLLVAAEVFATYARLPVRDLYHVSENGRAAGAGRALVFLNWPTALVAIPMVALVAAQARSRTISRLALLSVVLSAAVFWPGVVDEADLDAKWVNAIPAVGVLLALALTVFVIARSGFGPRTRAAGDRVRLVTALVLALLSLPWIAADLGFSILGSDKWYAGFGHARLHHHVHPGNHHGMVGTLLAVTAIVLSRMLGNLGPRLRAALGVYLAVLLFYGLGNFANDFWLEQLVKRGVTNWQVPSMIAPAANIPWLVLLVLAALVYVLVFRRIAPAEPTAPRRLIWPVVFLPAVVALLVVGGLAHGQTQHVTPRGSADGIAFAYAPEGTSHIFVTRSGELVQLTDSDGSELAPAWSPDHTRLAFQSNRDGNWEIYVANADGTDVRRLTDDDAEDGEPSWTPDGKSIAFVRHGDLYTMTADGRRLRHLADDVDWPSFSQRGTLALGRQRPMWSPGGNVFATSCLAGGDWRICVVDRVPGTRHVLTGHDSNAFAPAWSPDGKRIAFISDRDGLDQLFVMRADGTDVVRLTSGQGDKDTPAWSR
jgi:WD40-like Beta Propeller Repeat